MTSEKAELPETDEELEAFARYVLQEGADEGLQYSGPRGPDELNL